MRVGSLGQEDPLEEQLATHSSILAWKIPRTELLVVYSPLGRKESDMTERQGPEQCPYTCLYSFLSVDMLSENLSLLGKHSQWRATQH